MCSQMYKDEDVGMRADSVPTACLLAGRAHVSLATPASSCATQDTQTHRHTDTRTDRQAGVENKCWVSPCKHSRSKSASATTRTKPATAATTKPTAATATAKAAHSGVILIGFFGLLSRRARVCVCCV
jgi:hypothetical protein